jgi:nucleotide-binding universal stress UspA family protein
MAFHRSLPLTGFPRLAGDFQPTTARLLNATSRFSQTTKRLVVLVPDVDTHEHELARQIWALATARNLNILLLGVFPDAEREPRARRRLATLAALMRDDTVNVDTRLEMGSAWVTAIRAIAEKGDIIVCHAEQYVRRWGIRRQPLSRMLMQRLQTPICELTGFYPELPPDEPGLLARAAVPGIPVMIVVGFTALEVVVQQRAAGSSNYTLLMSMCVVLEYGLIGFWCFLLN